MKWIVQGTLVIVVTLMTIGFARRLKLNHLESGIVTTGQTEVSLSVVVIGTEGKPVKNAVVSVYDPEQRVLGKTDNSGRLTKQIALSSGRSLLIQAEGIAFKMQKRILLPRSRSYQTTVFFDRAEVHSGLATLITTENSETAILERAAPKPKPKLTLDLDFQITNLSEDKLLIVKKRIQSAAQKNKSITNSKLFCRNWKSVFSLYECTLSSKTRPSYSKLFKSFPESEADAESFIKSMTSAVEPILNPLPDADEFLFSFRNNGNDFRAYLGEEQLIPWKSKEQKSVFRSIYPKSLLLIEKPELTVITENGYIFQKKLNFEKNNRVISIKLPREDGLKLSKNEKGL